MKITSVAKLFFAEKKNQVLISRAIYYNESLTNTLFPQRFPLFQTPVAPLHAHTEISALINQEFLEQGGKYTFNYLQQHVIRGHAAC